MKKFTVSVAAALAMSTFAMAGGDIAPVEPVVEPVVEAVVDDSGFYIGGAYSLVTAEIDGSMYIDGYYGDTEYDGHYSATLESDWDAFMLQAGYQFNKYVAVEGRYWTSLGDADVTFTFDGESISGDVDSDFDAWGIYVKPMYPVTSEFNIYALLGYANVEIESSDDSGFSWGLGASYSFTENLSVFIDYVRLYDDSNSFVYEYSDSRQNYIYAEGDVDYTIDTWNFGLTYKF